MANVGGQKRTHVVKSAITTKRARAGVLTPLANRAHFHGCIGGCGGIYEDSCATPDVNGRCRPCRGLVRPSWDAARDPRPCCVGNTVQVTDADRILTFLLAGPGPWFQCSNCARCHPHPVTENP